MVTCLQEGANDLHVVQLMPLPLPSSPASLKPRMVISFWCQLTQVVLEKRLLKALNGCPFVCLTGPRDRIYYKVKFTANKQNHLVCLSQNLPAKIVQKY